MKATGSIIFVHDELWLFPNSLLPESTGSYQLIGLVTRKIYSYFNMKHPSGGFLNSLVRINVC